jgi:hypothetical protein
MEEILENRIIGIDEEKPYQSLLKTLKTVFKKIGQPDTDLLIDKRNIYFVLPINCTAQQTFINPLVNSDSRYPHLIPLWFISLRSDFMDMPKPEQIYTIAHELAHIFFEHGRGQAETGKHLARQNELEADEKVIQWGFEKELKKTPCNYKFGDGLKNRSLNDLKIIGG